MIKDIIHSISYILFDDRRRPTQTGIAWTIATILCFHQVLQRSGEGLLDGPKMLGLHLLLAVIEVVAVVAIRARRGTDANQQAAPRSLGSWGLDSEKWIIENCRILLVDDKQSMHCDVLRQRGFSIDKIDAVTKDMTIIEDRYDLLVLDVKGVRDWAGAKDGISALKTIRTMNPWIPVLILTSYKNDPKVLSHSSYYTAVVSKDSEFADLYQAVIAAIDGAAQASYFIERWTRLGVVNGERLIDAIKDGKSDVRPEMQERTAATVTEAGALFETAVSIYSKKRWSKK